jgi:hypothetical protein
MATILRNRFKHFKPRQRSPSLSATNHLPATQLDLEANIAFFDTSSPEARAIAFGASTNGRRATINDCNPVYSYSPPSATPLLVATATSLLVMFLSDPEGLLRAALSLLLFAPYPSWFRRWTILLPLLLPMSVQGRLELTTSLLLLIWLHVGCDAEWWFVIRRLEEAWEEWMLSLRK